MRGYIDEGYACKDCAYRMVCKYKEDREAIFEYLKMQPFDDPDKVFGIMVDCKYYILGSTFATRMSGK